MTPPTALSVDLLPSPEESTASIRAHQAAADLTPDEREQLRAWLDWLDRTEP